MKAFENILDVYGNPLVVGARVAFNYSGGVRIGVLKDIKKATHRGLSFYQTKPVYIFHVEHRLPGKTWPVVSKITSNNNLVVI
jgi:hypothetical protein